MFDRIVGKTKSVVNTRFFLRIFFPAHFDHWKLRKSLLVGGGGGGGENDSSVNLLRSLTIWFSVNNSCGDLICLNMMGSSIQMASSILNVNPGSHLKAKKCFKKEFKLERNLKISSKFVKFYGLS